MTEGFGVKLSITLAAAEPTTELTDTSFADLGVPENLVELQRRRRSTRPRPIQAVTISDVSPAATIG